MVLFDKSSALGKADQLIDFYELHKPDAGQRIPLYVTPQQLARLLSYPIRPGHKLPREFNYRGRILVCMLGEQT